mgnify:CR=1 FL=1
MTNIILEDKEYINNREQRISANIHIGDIVEILADGKFFQRGDEEFERYGGYVSSINGIIIGLSPTHHENRFHGYEINEINQPKSKRVETRIEIDRIIKYRTLLPNKQD